MTTYRPGTHHGTTIVRSGDGYRCGRPDHDCERGHMVAVVTNDDWALAERIAWLLAHDGTPDVTYLRGARDALAEVRRQLTAWVNLNPLSVARPAAATVMGMLRVAAAELGVDESAQVSASLQRQAGEIHSGVGRDTRNAHGGAEAPTDIVHLIRDGSATTACCHRAPFELAARDGHRLTVEPAAVTCGLVPRRRCICNDPPPTTTGKNQPATRPPGRALPTTRGGDLTWTSPTRTWSVSRFPPSRSTPGPPISSSATAALRAHGQSTSSTRSPSPR